MEGGRRLGNKGGVEKTVIRQKWTIRIMQDTKRNHEGQRSVKEERVVLEGKQKES